jgi:hypothetical protein
MTTVDKVMAESMDADGCLMMLLEENERDVGPVAWKASFYSTLGGQLGGASNTMTAGGVAP